MDAADSDLTFEQALQRLQEIVSELEKNEAGLEACIKSYEEGVAIAKQCLERLDNAELRVREVRIDTDEDA